MPVNEDALRMACCDVARQTLSGGGPISMTEVEKLGDQLVTYIVGMEYAETIERGGRDPNVVVRAVRYLAHVHAIPAMGTSIVWFEEMLQALIELACPSCGLPPEVAAFLDDVKAGIAEARADVDIGAR